MEILKPKRIREDKYWTKKFLKRCPNCKCEFSYTEKDVKQIFDFETTYVVCPECENAIRVPFCRIFRKKYKVKK